jgi:predicted DNA repair protein MutK
MSATIFALLDDVVALTKAAAGKTVGVVGDDMAAGAQSMVGLSPDRELPVVWAVAKGSLANKVLLIVGALLLSSFAGALIPFLLSAGGLFLAYEGAEKCLALMGLGHGEDEPEDASEAEKIKGAIRTDLVLSAEIIVLSLAFVTGKPLLLQVAVLVAVGVALTLCVYGTVAFLIKLDDMGAWLARRSARAWQAIGRAILAGVPYLLQALTVGGAIAMILVGGGVLLHNVPTIAETVGLGDGAGHAVHAVLAHLEDVPLGGILADLVSGWVAAGCAMAVSAGYLRLARALKRP